MKNLQFMCLDGAALYTKKAADISEYVAPLAKRVSPTIKSLEYSAPIHNGRIQGEYITLQYLGGGVKTIDVTATSLAYIAIAVLQAVA